MATRWQLNDALARDSHHLGKWGDTHLLLHRNAALHWFMLVPETDCLDLTDLAKAERDELLDQAGILGRFLKSRLSYPRVNIGALGLVVPQLHLHVVGRRPGDPCWPGPVWGQLEHGLTYPDQDIVTMKRELSSIRE